MSVETVEMPALGGRYMRGADGRWWFHEQTGRWFVTTSGERALVDEVQRLRALLLAAGVAS